MSLPIITIGRSFGSGGRIIGEKVATLLNIPLYDKELVKITAEKSGFHASVVEQMQQNKPASLLYSLSGSVVENSPNSVCEALLLGVPTVASNVGGTSDVLAHKKEGYLYECDHAVMGAYYIDRIFSSREEAEAFGREAQKGAHARHSREGNYETLKRIYKVISSNEKEVSL